MVYFEILERIGFYMSRSHLVCDKWPAINTYILEKINNCKDNADFSRLVNDSFEKCAGVSHLRLISPEEIKMIEDTKDETEKMLECKSWLRGGVLYVKISTFEDCKFLSCFMASEGAERIVLDLRLNCGGSLYNAMKLLSLFIPQDEVFGYTHSQFPIDLKIAQKKIPIQNLRRELDLIENSKAIAWVAQSSKKLKKELHLLIGENCFSMGELVAHTLKKKLNCLTWGEKTAGQVLIGRDDFDCNHGFSLLLPVAYLSDSEGTVLEHNPVLPDQYISFPVDLTCELSYENVKNILNLI